MDKMIQGIVTVEQLKEFLKCIPNDYLIEVCNEYDVDVYSVIIINHKEQRVSFSQEL